MNLPCKLFFTIQNKLLYMMLIPVAIETLFTRMKQMLYTEQPFAAVSF